MIWKKIDDYNYSINEIGQVKNDKNGYILKFCIGIRGYYCLRLCKNGISKMFTKHRLLAKYFLKDYSDDLIVDHIDRNPLNNNLDNLRMVTTQQNTCNATKKKNCTSKYKGVSYCKRTNKWECFITNQYKKKYIGHFNTEIYAAKAYNKYLDDNNLTYHPKNEIDDL